MGILVLGAKAWRIWRTRWLSTLHKTKILDRRFRQYAVVILICLIIILSVWKIRIVSKPPNFFRNSTYTLNSENDTYTYPVRTLNETDYSQLMDLKNFSFTILNTPCNESYPFIIILVHSAPWNFKKRRTIRETWGESTDNIKLLFMLGQVKNKTLQRQVEQENETYGDFVQGSFKDSYRNLTYKHAMVLKYVIYHCENAKYLVKTDDDVFVNTFTLVNYLKNDLSPYGASNLLICNGLKPSKLRVGRSYRSKWRVSFKEYPQKYYPFYCEGFTLIYSKNVVFNLYKELQNASYFWIDDVLITGVLFQKLNLMYQENTMKITYDDQCRIIRGEQTSPINPFLYGRGEISKYGIRMLWQYAIKYRNHTNQNEIITNSSSSD